jgi:carbamoyl-phosphate synthase small subunit
MTERAILVLEDGTAYRGFAFGAKVDGEGEVVFNTSMTGYQEICTDPSYGGQMVALTYPLIGNYGVTRLDAESIHPWVAGLIVRSYYEDYSNWRAESELDGYLEAAGVPAIYGVDTRALTRRLRSGGTMRAVLTRYAEEAHDAASLAALVERARNVTPLSEKDLVGESAVGEAYDLAGAATDLPRVKVVVVDCGIKRNILRSLSRRGAAVTVVPHSATAEEVLALDPDGVLVGNGPGDPATLPAEVETVRGLLASRRPLFGICLGHQLLGQAIGGRTSRLRFGHHGGNHPVKDLASGEVHITSQNHEFQLDRDSIPPDSGFFVSQVNLNDGSVEGLGHPTLPVFSVQYHPEGAPGPQDNQYLFDRFLALVRDFAASRNGAAGGIA